MHCKHWRISRMLYLNQCAMCMHVLAYCCLSVGYLLHLFKQWHCVQTVPQWQKNESIQCHSKSFTNVRNKIEYSLTDKITTATNSFNRVENERKIKNHTCIDITLHIISGYIHIYFSSTIHIIFFTSIWTNNVWNFHNVLFQ